MSLTVTAFFMAWGMFWIVPCPLKRWDERGRIGMLLFLPVIGLFIGLVWAFFLWLRERFLPGLFGAAVLAVVPYVLSGFIHLDGYMDCADAVLSRRDRETRLRILKDSHVGTFAAVALTALLLLEFSVFAGYSFREKLWCLPFVCAAPRAVSTVTVLLRRPLEGSSYERMFSGGVPAKARYTAGGVLLILVLLPILLFGRAGLCAIIGCLGSGLAIAYIRHDLGGMSGDVSGAGITVGELCGLAALALL